MAGTSVEHAAGDVPESVYGSAAPAGDVEHAPQNHLIKYNPDAPSEAWGWHGSWHEFAPLGTRVLLWIGVLTMFIMLIGNHVSNVENLYLIGIGLLMAVWLLRNEARIRRERRRKP